MLAWFSEFLNSFEWWQIIPLVLMVALIVFWKWYRSKQM